MAKLLDYLNNLNKKKFGAIFLSLCFFASVAIFILPQFKKTTKLNLNTGDVTITANNQDSLGVSTTTQFTVKSTGELNLSDLKANLSIFPETEFNVEQVSPQEYTIIPKITLKGNRVYNIKIKTAQKDLSWAFQTKNNFRVTQSLPRDKSSSVPVNTGIEIVFSHENWQEAKDLFSISPNTKGRFERHKKTFSFVPESLKADTLYTVTLKKGLKLNGSTEQLESDYQFQFETGSDSPYDPQISLSKSYYEFSTSTPPAFDLYVSDGDNQKINVNVYKYQSDAKFKEDFGARLLVPKWAYNTSRTYQFNTQPLAKVSSFEASVQKQVYTNYFIFPEPLPVGQYLVSIEYKNQKLQSLFQVTNISSYFTLSGSKTLLWVNDLSSGLPVAGAKVSLKNSNSETNNNGVAYFDTDPQDLDGGSSIVSISHSTGSLLIPNEEINNYYDYKKYQNRSRERDKYWSYIYLDRPTYLPGDTAKFWGLLKYRDNLTKKLNLTVQVTRADYNSDDNLPMVLFQKEVPTTDMGTFLNEIPLVGYQSGWYDIEILVDNKTVLTSGFSVDNYIKPAYSITLTPSSKSIIYGDNVNIVGQANFFEGSPVVGLELNQTSYNTKIANQFTTNSQGRFSFNASLSSQELQKEYSPQTMSFNVVPKNPEEGNIYGGANVAVFNSSLVFTWSQVDTKNNQGKVTIDLRKVDTAKYSPNQDLKSIFEPAPDRNIKTTTYETEWVKKEVGTYYDFISKKTTPRYEYNQVKNKIGEGTVQTNQSGQAYINMAVPENKSYEIQLEAQDDQGRSTYQTAYLWGTHGQGNTVEYLSLKTNKLDDKPNAYQIGENVTLDLYKGSTKAVIGSKDQVLYILSQRGIRSYHLSKDGSLSFKFPEEFSPNVYAQAILFNGETYQASETTILSFNSETKKLSLNLSLNKPQYAPADKAKISVLVKDSVGNPVVSEVNLNLVDEAFYSLYPENINPLSELYRFLESDVLSFYLSHQYPLDKGGAEGGGCFLGGTEVLMANGQTKKIEDVKVGDFIKTKVSPNSTKLISTKVLNKFVHKVDGYILLNNQLRVTTEHNLYINGRWITAGEIRLGDSFLGIDGEYHKVVNIQVHTGINTVYNLETENQHTYFADGYYVHNDKGGSLFKDTAFFGTLTTNSQGVGSVEVSLPDNLTSWRISSQALTNNLQAGSSTLPLVVKLPFFITAVMNSEYLQEDNPVLYVRAFGDSLKPEDAISLKVESTSLGINKNFTGKAFEAIPVDLGKLKQGDHKITFNGTSTSGQYKLERSFRVTNSHQSYTVSKHQPLIDPLNIEVEPSALVNLTFTDTGLGQYYPMLTDLASTWGDRLDQKVARHYSQKLIKEYFDDQITVEELNLNPYRTQDGALAIFPYATTDLELTAFIGSMSLDNLSDDSLASYFYSSISSSKDMLSLSQSLYGISSQTQPVLLQINSLLEDDKIPLNSQLYLGLSLIKTGDTERARVLYKTLLGKYLVTEGDFSHLKSDNDKDNVLQNTALITIMSSQLGEPEAPNFLRYLNSNSAKDILVSSQKLLAIESLLKNTSPQPASFDYIQNGKTTTVKLEKGKNVKLSLSFEDLKSIKFANISGPVGVVSTYSVSPKSESVKTNNSISVQRSYSVNGKLTNQFNPSDLVKVSLSFTADVVSQDGCYQVTDLLPSGLRVITSPYVFGINDNNVYYPYEVSGQRVSFCVYPNNANRTINYYARVLNGGIYKSESTIIQSLLNPSILNFSDSAEVFIK